MKIKKKKVSTNKWLELEDWAALYKILERAILRNVRPEKSLRDLEECKWKKSTRQLEITYTFESSQNAKDVTSLPTIRVNVSPAKRKSKKTESSEAKSEKGEISDQTSEKSRSDISGFVERKDNGNARLRKPENDVTRESNDAKSDKSKRYLHIDGLENDALEEYVPDAPVTKKFCTHLKYIPSRKSTLERIQSLNEYSPTISDNKSPAEVVRYIPNSVDSSKVSYETYEPSATTIIDLVKEYIPTSKGVKASVEEYQPDFTSKLMKFDDSYVPSSVLHKRSTEKVKKEQSVKHSSRHKDSSSKKTTNLFT